MKVENIKSSENFRGYYKLPYKGAEKEIIDSYLPKLLEFKELYIHSFIGSNPESSLYMSYVKNTAEANNASVHWVHNHAKNFGLDVPIDELDTITIVTGRKDREDILKFSAKQLLKGVARIVKFWCKSPFLTHNPTEPLYIRHLKMIAKDFQTSQKAFDKFMANKDLKYVEKFSNFIEHLRCEVANSIN